MGDWEGVERSLSEQQIFKLKTGVCDVAGWAFQQADIAHLDALSLNELGIFSELVEVQL